MTTFRGKFYDGLTSEGTEITVELTGTNVLRVTGLPQPLEVSLDAVQVAPRLGNTVRKLTLPGGATCETEDHAALDALVSRAGNGKPGRILHQLESNWRVAIAATILLLALIAAGSRWGIPVAAKYIAGAIPPAMAYDLGQGTLALLDRSMLAPSQLSAERQSELAAGFARLADNYPVLPLRLNFRRGAGPNAFALPDGSVIVTDELVALARDDNQIYSVLMHEIGHVHHRHALRMALESSTVMLLVSTYMGDVTQLSTLSSAMPAVIAQSHYSREHETEADTFALAYMDRLRIPRKHYADLLRALQTSVGRDPDHGLQYLASHPPTSERIRRFEQ